MAVNQRLRCITALILMSLEVTLSAETSPVPVYEVINEQSKADDRKINTGKTDLPYGNPLAGNSQTNAQLHAHNQQAMFNAERVRQHKAQLQRWTKTPLINNYMRAYHESQESHQLALEQQQTKVKDKPQSAKISSEQVDPVEKSDSVMERKRNQRSYGSIEYQLVDPRYRNTPTVYTQTRIKPNSINQMVQSLTSKLYTGDDTRAYQKYYPSQEYSSIQNIETLNSLLSKNPGDQLTGFNALINSAQTNVNHDKELETPIDLYFYLKDPHNKAAVNAQLTNAKDHTPIREDVNEADDTREPVGFLPHSVLATPQLDVTATRNIEFINSELTSQILSTGYNPLLQDPAKGIEVGHQVHYIQPNSYDHDIQAEEDLSKRYLHHSNKGVQHLSEDGTISAYNDKVSNSHSKDDRTNYNHYHKVVKRSSETNQSLPLPSTSIEVYNNTELPVPESLIRLRSPTKRTEFGTFLTTPNFPIGEAIDYHNEHKPSRHAFYDEGDYDDYGGLDYEESDHKVSDTPIPKNRFSDAYDYAPSQTYVQNVRLDFTKHRPIKRVPPTAPSIGIYGNTYAITPTYGPQYSYTPNVEATNLNHFSEPVYLLTQSQLSKLVGHHNLNIEHLDVYQLSKNKRPSHYPRRYKKRSPFRNKQFRKNILKLQNLHVI